MRFYVCKEGESIPPSLSSNDAVSIHYTGMTPSEEEYMVKEIQCKLMDGYWDDEASHTEFIASDQHSFPITNNVASRFGCTSTIHH